MRFNRKCLYSMNILSEIRTNILIYHNLSVKSALKYIVFCPFWYFYWVFLNTKLHLNKLLNSFHFADITHITADFKSLLGKQNKLYQLLIISNSFINLVCHGLTVTGLLKAVFF